MKLLMLIVILLSSGCQIQRLNAGRSEVPANACQCGKTRFSGFELRVGKTR